MRKNRYPWDRGRITFDPIDGLDQYTLPETVEHGWYENAVPNQVQTINIVGRPERRWLPVVRGLPAIVLATAACLAWPYLLRALAFILEGSR